LLTGAGRLLSRVLAVLASSLELGELEQGPLGAFPFGFCVGLEPFADGRRGLRNTASGPLASVLGGLQNTAGAEATVVLGGTNVTDNNPFAIAPTVAP